MGGPAQPALDALEPLGPEAATRILQELASVFEKRSHSETSGEAAEHASTSSTGQGQVPNLEAKYRALLEQLPAVVFMAYLDRGIGEAYVSPQIEAALGYSQD